MQETYGNPNATRTVIIANGGAGPTGIIRAFAESFLDKTASKDLNIRKSFSIFNNCAGWIQSHTQISLQHIKDGTAQTCLTYEPDLEKPLLETGEAENYKYIFHDHFMLVGPKGDTGLEVINHPASLKEVLETFAKLPHLKKDGEKVYISRDDGSATNAKEMAVFHKAGIQLPTESNSWYYRMPANAPRFPLDCLRMAVETKSFCLIDRGTFLLNKEAQEHLSIYVQGGEEDDDVLLNPCHALVSTKDTGVKQEAIEFVNFMAGKEGQKIVKTFGVDKESNILKLPFFTPANDYDL